jgi:hypothetical protein
MALKSKPDPAAHSDEKCRPRNEFGAPVMLQYSMIPIVMKGEFHGLCPWVSDDLAPPPSPLNRGEEFEGHPRKPARGYSL